MRLEGAEDPLSRARFLMTNVHTHRAHPIGTSSLVLASIGLLAVGCLRKNVDHCIFRGGDFGVADTGTICIAPLEEATERSGGEEGYIRLDSGTRIASELPADAIPESYIWARFGVPRRIGGLGADDGLETIVGVLDRARRERGLECSFESEELTAIAADVKADFEAFHDAVDQGGRRSKAPDIRLPVESIESMNQALERLLANCEGSPAGSGTGTTGQDTGQTTDGSTTTDGDPCTVSADCGGGPTPYCNPAGECVPCDSPGVPDDFCDQQSADTPVCAALGCVACSAEDTSVCDADLLLCDDVGGECVPCAEHAQCEAGACDIFEGRCFDPLSVVHAGQGQRFSSINAALAAAAGDDVEGAVIVLHEGPDFNEAVGTTTDGAIAFVSAAGERPVWIQTVLPQSPNLSVLGGARVYMDGVQLSDNRDEQGLVQGISCVAGRVDIRRSRIIRNNGGGIRVQGTCEVQLRTSYVGANGLVGPGAHGLRVDGGTVTALYSTIAHNDEIAVDSILCTNDAMVSIRNSIIVGQDAGSIDCPGIQIETSAVDEPIGDNVNVGAADLAWFADGVDGDFGLREEGATVFEDIAVWLPGDPVLDIDGDARPAGRDGMDYVGADVP